MKVLFVEPVGTGLPPMGVLYLSSALKEHGYKDIKLASVAESEPSYKRSKQYLMDCLEEKPDFVGITATTPVLIKAIEIAKLAKGHGCFVMIGGAGAANIGKKILERYSFVDALCMGEAELTIVKIVGCVEKDKHQPTFFGITGIVWRSEGEIIANKPASLIKDLNALPFPDRSLLDFNTYHGAFSIITSRGCPFNCSFCFKPIHKNIFRGRTPKNVAMEIQDIVERFPEQFKDSDRIIVIADDIFNCDLERAKKVLNAIKDMEVKIKVVAVNGFHVKPVDFELLEKFKEAGGIVLWFGVDSGSEEILSKLGKGITPDMVREAFKLAKKAGIETVGGHFIIGLEGETPATARETIAFAKSLPLDEVGFNHANVLPETRLWDWVMENGKLLYPTDGIDFFHYQQLKGKPVFETPEFTKEEREKAFEEATALTDKVRRRNTLKPKKILRFILSLRSFGDVLWAFDRAKVFFYSRNLRLAKKAMKPSQLRKLEKEVCL